MKLRNYINDEGVFYEMPVPGFAQDDLDITFMEGWFIVKGQRTAGNGEVVNIDYTINAGVESRVLANIHNGLLILQVIKGSK